MRYQFIAEHQHEYPIAQMCRVLDVSASGYYAWGKRQPSEHTRKDAELAEQIRIVFQANRAFERGESCYYHKNDCGINDV
ncbi:hypothetical protein KSB_83290 [Ktedonobacter robiniae]|uniref:IS3 family transposase n=1 Tax=Ktedonobacter robiniae TaxID=2778365 RepID=A0ABQ3V3X1_9CHLR|nr:hypothetical protein [Ktedonobacter robiniae]GHO59854.1 hypothetical protein KSB_83290 [Ktedonobacter robiniae]